MKNKLIITSLMVMATAMIVVITGCTSREKQNHPVDAGKKAPTTATQPAATPSVGNKGTAGRQQAQDESMLRRAREAARLRKMREAAMKKYAPVTASPMHRLHRTRPGKPRSVRPGFPRHPVGHARVDREKYAKISGNPVKRVVENPVSTFSIDVDTGAYANVRRFLLQGSMPPIHAVRIEEMINYFSYDYERASSRSNPFSVTTEIARTPWNKKTYLLHVGIKGYNVPRSKLPPSNLVFLIDVSGSMDARNKLDLLKSSMKMLTRKLGKNDKVTIVVYAGTVAVALDTTPGNEKQKIISAIDSLYASGSTNGGEAIQLAYRKARASFIKNGINRIILATDGDFNVGTTDFDSLKRMVVQQRKSGISLTTLGFGAGNYNDRLMEQLADAGNGNHAYIDTMREARKVLVSELSATLFTIAKDVKVQIEFNPAVVAEYRLVGYENRLLKREDFRNDKVDAGEIGAGHTVTAIYEIALVGDGGNRIPALRYQGKKGSGKDFSGEIAFLKIRYKQPQADKSTLKTWKILKTRIRPLEKAGNNFRFSAAVAAFGQKLRGGKYMNDFSYKDIVRLAMSARGKDVFGYRSEFISLVRLADAMAPQAAR